MHPRFLLKHDLGAWPAAFAALLEEVKGRIYSASMAWWQWSVIYLIAHNAPTASESIIPADSSRSTCATVPPVAKPCKRVGCICHRLLALARQKNDKQYVNTMGYCHLYKHRVLTVQRIHQFAKTKTMWSSLNASS